VVAVMSLFCDLMGFKGDKEAPSELGVWLTVRRSGDDPRDESVLVLH
jgi:hypothetical protein